MTSRDSKKFHPARAHTLDAAERERASQRRHSYAVTSAQEAARRGVELRDRIETDVDQSRAPGVRPDWYLDVDADADPAVLAELKQQSDGHCPSVFCIRHPIDLGTHVDCPR